MKPSGRLRDLNILRCSAVGARTLDKRLLGVATKLGLTYTRCADDLSFSGGAELSCGIGWLLAKVRHIAQEEGFAVNERKTRVRCRSAAQTVTGVVVNAKPSIDREELRRLRAILHRMKSEGWTRRTATAGRTSAHGSWAKSRSHTWSAQTWAKLKAALDALS